MAEIEKPARKRPHRATSQGFRDQRAGALEAALRANLKRRKAAGKANEAMSPIDHANAQKKDSEET